MAINLDLEPYCNNCRNFEAETIKRSDWTDIRVVCAHAQQCKFIARYLLNKLKETENGQNEP